MQHFSETLIHSLHAGDIDALQFMMPCFYCLFINTLLSLTRMLCFTLIHFTVYLLAEYLKDIYTNIYERFSWITFGT